MLVDNGRQTRAHLESVSAVGGLKVVRPVTAHLKHAFDRRGHVFVQAVGELNDDDGAFTGRTQKSADYGTTRLAANLSQDHFHP